MLKVILIVIVVLFYSIYVDFKHVNAILFHLAFRQSVVRFILVNILYIGLRVSPLHSMLLPKYCVASRQTLRWSQED